MSKKYVGWIVSLKCNDGVDTYQGQITDVIEDNVSLRNVFCNGMPHTSSVVTLDAKDILQVKIISTNEVSTTAEQTQPRDKVTVKRPIAKRADRSISEPVPTCVPPSASQTQSQLKKAVDAAATCVAQSTNGKVVLSEATGKLGQKKLYQKQRALGRDEHTFGSPIDQSVHEEFDFEKNLALFDKEAVWQEINSLKPDIVRQSESNKGIAGTYRPDENIIDSKPTVFRQIMVPYAGEREYVTDNGLVIPSITLSLHQLLIGAADRLGISWERRVELLGRAGAEIILQLLGGSHRLNPNNAHQWPTVVALCGSHRPGAAGVNCARQLSSHGVKTIVFVEKTENIFLLQELSLYKLTENKVETKVRNLPTMVDLIIVALCDEYSSQVITPIATWANSNKAPILAIEPPSTGTPGILSKFSLLGGLPLSHSMDNGRLYLCNLALPQKVYRDVGITYKSPFGPKFVIPLHSNNS